MRIIDPLIPQLAEKILIPAVKHTHKGIGESTGWISRDTTLREYKKRTLDIIEHSAGKEYALSRETSVLQKIHFYILHIIYLHRPKHYILNIILRKVDEKKRSNFYFYFFLNC